MLVRIINPITQKVLLNDVPGRCKNFIGAVEPFEPIDDLERCIRNSNAQVAYLFILGELSAKFKWELERRRDSLRQELHRPVSFEVVNDDRIAELYASFIVRHIDKTASAR